MLSRIGKNIYLSRKIKGWTQEQLAESVGVSSVAVSKWERSVTIPDIEILCRLADLFSVSLDELLGRVEAQIGESEKYSQEQLADFELGEKLVEYYRIWRNSGWSAVHESAKKEQTDEFLFFAVTLLVAEGKKRISKEWLRSILVNYAEKETDKNRCKMICDVLLAIEEGADEGLLKEIIASHLGRTYRDKFVIGISGKESREEVLQQYIEKPCTADLLENMTDCDDRTIQLILRQLDNETLVSALHGASGLVCQKFLRNVSDRLLYFLTVDIAQFAGSKDEVIRAQKRIQEIAAEM